MASGQTSNYGLNQWAAEDKVLRTDFNQDNAKLDEIMREVCTALPQIVCGTYTGNGSAEQFISLGFTPRAVFVCSDQGITVNSYNRYYYGGLAICGNPVKTELPGSSVEITEGGFKVFSLNSASVHVAANASSQVGHYIAFG